ncbi:toxin-antitoxin system YwqK family antitoxin [Leptonema illini]|uniref:MORN variant repeat-containing protein n=1 Tax=Leptonema illini DSM 21528 TaxID=929563 RepID=H2CH54_9LEPT|nr:toxin-antitoxin system YwqK family antitoxin [Leptonema illini]EHQ06924.1 MORN variant repeat-containing protein [Leptonema illini DSM 21528]
MRRILALFFSIILTGTLAANQNRPTGLPEGARYVAAHRVWVQESASHQIVWYADGTKKSEGDLKQGQRDGAWVFFHANGNKRAEGSYTAGRMTGPWKLYYKSGKLQSEGEYRNGSKQGPWTVYFESGRKKSDGTYAGGLKNGPWTEYYESGAVFFKGIYVADLAHGQWIYYFQNGAFYQGGTYSEDVRTGIWKVCIAPGGPCGEEIMRQNEPPRVSGLPKEQSTPAGKDPMSILDGPAPENREELPPSLQNWNKD